MYRLIVLTHGDGAPLPATLDSFREHVTPSPTSIHFHRDGPTGPALTIPNVAPAGLTSWTMSREPEGFCVATARCWSVAAAAPEPWVFWLEHDFVFTRPVDLRAIAAVFAEQPQLAQMALYRNAVSDEELRHGGYLNLPGRSYEPRGEGPDWFEHHDYWTTNPCLFRREIAQRFEWPIDPRCEGKFGFILKAGRAGTTFGVWGDGTPQVAHDAPRTGFGY